jgi:hypothetical protein
VPEDWAGWAIAASRARPDGGLGAMLTAMPSSATAPRWPRIGDFRTIRLYRIAEDHTIGNLVADDGLLALVPERHLDGKTDCPADAGLRDSRAGDRHLRCSDRLSPVTEDRPHFYVQTLDAASADAPAIWPS